MATATELSPEIVHTPATPPSFPPLSLLKPHRARPPGSISMDSNSGCSTPRASSLQSLISHLSLNSYPTTSSLTSLPSSEGTSGGYSADMDHDDACHLDACCFSPPSPPLLSSTTPFSSPLTDTDEEEKTEAEESKQAFLQLRATKAHSSLFHTPLDVDRELSDGRLTKGNLEALHHWDYERVTRKSDEEEEETASISPNPSLSCDSDVTVFGTVTPRCFVKGRGLEGVRMKGTSVCSKLSRSDLRNEQDEHQEAEEGETAVNLALEELVRVGHESDSVPVEELNVMVRWALGLLGVRVVE